MYLRPSGPSGGGPATGAGFPVAGAPAGPVAGGVSPERAPLLAVGVDATAWKLEAERLAPKLRAAATTEARDWRGHLEEAGAAVDAIGQVGCLCGEGLLVPGFGWCCGACFQESSLLLGVWQNTNGTLRSTP